MKPGEIYAWAAQWLGAVMLAVVIVALLAHGGLAERAETLPAGSGAVVDMERVELAPEVSPSPYP